MSRLNTTGNPNDILMNLSYKINSLPSSSKTKSKLANFALEASRNSKLPSDFKWAIIQDYSLLFKDKIILSNGDVIPSIKNDLNKIGGSAKGSQSINVDTSYTNDLGSADNANKSFFKNNISNNTTSRRLSGIRDTNLIQPNISSTNRSVNSYSRVGSGDELEEKLNKLTESLSLSTRTVVNTHNFQEKILSHDNTISIKFANSGLELRGFIDESGIDIGINNKYDNLFGQGMFTSLGTMLQQGRVLKGDLSAFTHQVNTAMQQSGGSLSELGNKLKSSGGLQSATGYTGESSIILNTAMYYAGSEPLHVSFKFYQIANQHGEILNNYRDALRAASPELEAGARINWNVQGPDLADISLWGKLELKRVLIENLTCHIKGPFDTQRSPVIGEYTFKGKSEKIVDKLEILKIFTPPDVIAAVNFFISNFF